jgi:alkylated DNA nucleotide flippase Atl1
MMEPTVFADKSGQAMVHVDMAQLMGHGRRVSEVMDNLDYEANHGMYKALRHKLIRDYGQIIQNIIANNEVILTSQDVEYVS